MTLEDVRKAAFAMPLTSPSYPVGPYRFSDREYMIISYRTNREALERIVPEPLEFIEAVVRYEFIRMTNSTGFGTYAGSEAPYASAKHGLIGL
jgi:acetoacetate decarboxylase